jgi:hypothetical protein
MTVKQTMLHENAQCKENCKVLCVTAIDNKCIANGKVANVGMSSVSFLESILGFLRYRYSTQNGIEGE